MVLLYFVWLCEFYFSFIFLCFVVVVIVVVILLLDVSCWILPCSLLLWFSDQSCLAGSPCLGKRELVYMLLVHLFVYMLLPVFLRFLLVSGIGCGLWLWHSLELSLKCMPRTKRQLSLQMSWLLIFHWISQVVKELFKIKWKVALAVELVVPCIRAYTFSTWAATWQNQKKNECATNEDSDQPGHPPSLIRVFAVRMKKALVFS